MIKFIHKGIKLRKIRKSDSGYFLKWWKDDELIKLTSGVFEKSDQVLGKYFLSMMGSEKDNHFMILFKSKSIGHIALLHSNKEKFEIQIVIGEKKLWGRGLGTEAIRQALKIAFQKLKYEKAYIEVRPDNRRAIGAYTSCGFHFQGIKKYPRNKKQPVVNKMILLKSPSSRVD